MSSALAGPSWSRLDLAWLDTGQLLALSWSSRPCSGPATKTWPCEGNTHRPTALTNRKDPTGAGDVPPAKSKKGQGQTCVWAGTKNGVNMISTKQTMPCPTDNDNRRASYPK